MAPPADPVAPVAPADERITLSVVRQRHVAQLRRMAALPDDAARRGQAEAMREQIAAAGAFLDDWAERDSAQGLIDYWTTVLAALPGGEGYPAMLDLVAFDPATRRSLKGVESPFVGLNPFGTGDRDRFFGRDQAAHALWEVVERQPLTVVSGPSGSGKSSLVLAGLLPLMRQAGARTLLPMIVPGNDPVAALLAAVRPEDAPQGWTDAERGVLHRRPARLAELAEALPGGPRGVLLAVDQAEELFTLEIDATARQTVFDALAALIDRPLPHRLVLTIRSDYTDALQAIPALFPPGASDAGERDPIIFVPDPLTSRELHDAIVRPAERIGLKIDADVVEDLVREVIGEPAALPLLQFALSRLWSRTEVDRITWADYLKVGKPSEALRRIAEQLYADLRIGENWDATRLIFLALIKPAQGAESVRRRVRRETLRKLAAADRIDHVLAHFVSGGLLRRTPGQEADDDRFEVAHETLIRHWPRLAEWLEQRRRADAARERLLAAAEQWRKSSRERGYLLTGVALEQAAAYAGTAPELDEFLAESRRWARIITMMRLGIAVAVACALLIAAGFAVAKWRLASNETERADRQQEEATAQTGRAVDAVAQSSTADARALIAEQTLARLLADGTVPAADIPAPLLARLQPPPPATVAMMRGLRGYDPGFLGVPLPLPPLRGSMVRLDYRNFSVVYDPATRLPLIAASNVDRLAVPLPASAASLPIDPRLPADRQPAGFADLGPELARVPLVGWNEVGWGAALPPETARSDFRPVTVLQPWSYNQGPWADVSRALLLIKANNLVIASGPVLRADDPVVDGARRPRAFWKLAAYRDADGGLLSQAYLIPVNAPVQGGTARFRILLADLQSITGLDFRGVATGARAKLAAPTKPLVYLQFEVMTRERARGITAALADAGYIAPGEEHVASALGLHEVRYYHAADAATARAIAADTSRLLIEQGFAPQPVVPRLIRLGTGIKPPRAGVFELWLGIGPDDSKAG